MVLKGAPRRQCFFCMFVWSNKNLCNEFCIIKHYIFSIWCVKDHLDYGVLLCENNCCTTFVWFAFTLYFFNSMCYQTKLIEYCFICSISEKCLTVFLFFCLTVFGKSNSKTSVWSNKISVWKRRKKCLIRQKNKKTRSVNGP